MTRSYNSVNKKKDFVQQFFDSFEGHFTHALCRRTGSINVFLHAIAHGEKIYLGVLKHGLILS